MSRSHLRRPTTLALLAAGLALPCSAQGTLKQDETFTFLKHANSGLGGPCITGPFSSSIEIGTLELRADGTWSVAVNEKTVCPGGAVTHSSDPAGGLYTLATDGTLALQMSPTEQLQLALRFDHGLISNGAGATLEPGLTLAVKQATSTPPTAGTFSVVRLVQRQELTGLTVTLDVGTLVIGSGGSWSESGQRHALTPTGTTDSTYAIAGTLAAASNGTLVVQPGSRAGAASADGELLLWAEDLGVETGLTIAVRRGGSHTAAALGGGWKTIAHGAEQGPGTDLPRAWGFGANGTVSGVTGAASFSGSGVEVDATGESTMAVAEAGVLTTDAAGLLTWVSSVSPGPPFSGGLAQNEAFAVIGDLASPGSAEIVFLWKACVAPLAYGLATPGTGGVAPTLGAVGGLPTAGNASFALRIQQGVGAGNGLLLVTTAPAPGLPLAGGTLWVGGATLVSQGISLSGLAGASGVGSATISLPLPGGPAVIGFDLHAQAAVLDAGAIGGLSFTPGLAFEICQ